MWSSMALWSSMACRCGRQWHYGHQWHTNVVINGIFIGLFTSARLEASVDDWLALKASLQTQYGHQWHTKSWTTSALRPWVLPHTWRWHAVQQAVRRVLMSLAATDVLRRCHATFQQGLAAADFRPSLLCVVRCPSCSSWLSLQATSASRPCAAGTPHRTTLLHLVLVMPQVLRVAQTPRKTPRTSRPPAGMQSAANGHCQHCLLHSTAQLASGSISAMRCM
jgi:hypothetical protein